MSACLVCDLSGAELRVRLLQRGVAPLRVWWLMNHRDEPTAHRVLVRLLCGAS